MKRALLAGLAVAALAATLPARVSAGNVITPTTVDPRVASECVVHAPPDGPSRATHSSPAVVAEGSAPDCDAIPGLCVTVQFLVGPSRVTHSRPAKPAPVPAPSPCTPLGEACAYSINYYDYIPPPGPSRPAHQVAGPLRPMIPEQTTVPIPAACQELMVLALVPTGAESRSTVWIATAFLAVGAALILVPRRLARR